MIDDKRLAEIEEQAGALANWPAQSGTAEMLRDLVVEVRRLQKIALAAEKRVGQNVSRAWVYGETDQGMRDIALAVAEWRGVAQSR